MNHCPDNPLMNAIGMKTATEHHVPLERHVARHEHPRHATTAEFALEDECVAERALHLIAKVHGAGRREVATYPAGLCGARHLVRGAVNLRRMPSAQPSDRHAARIERKVRGACLERRKKQFGGSVRGRNPVHDYGMRQCTPTA